ncbi:hypothetical protein GP486_002700 [Trichoglossum hirsutum]|uniref:Telomere length regulation protein conserved domain-containing protein n=1 Tax=Trichoglossum hirsutum TaxID=265104 RepID=A0A9P8LEL2_9PEZI|nr:hypothetical protein GP486_002700 [Trichoglossum hirsutum]
MDELLTTIRAAGGSNEQLFAKAAEVKEVQKTPRGPILSLDDALETLRSKPDFETLERLLLYLDPDAPGKSNSNINVPNPEAARVVNILVNSTIPDFWANLDEKPQGKARPHPNERAILLRCLSSVGGLGAILARLQTLIASSKEGKGKAGNSDISQHILEMLDIVKYLLKDTKFILKIWNGIRCLAGARPKRTVLWNEFVSIMGGGKLLSTVAEAYDIVKTSRKDIMQSYWIASGNRYCAWVGRSAARMVLDLREDDQDAWKAAAQLLGKSFSLGYMDEIVEQVCSSLLLEDEEQWAKLRALQSQLPAHEQRNFLYSLLRVIGKRHFKSGKASDKDSWWLEDVDVVSGAAALLHGVVGNSESLKENLVVWLTNTWGGGVGEAIGIRRAAIAAIAQDEDTVQEVLEKSLQQFGDKLYIKHTPILHQEVNAQILLLASGYVHRSHPIYLLTLARSSIHLNGVSNRLAASSVRSRFLGMVVGTAISSLIDKPDKIMNFSMEEMDSSEAAWYKSLTGVQDWIGSISSLKTPTTDKLKGSETTSGSTASCAKRPIGSTSKIVRIEEIESDDEDDGLIPYEKPDSDEEDEDDDPTLVQRNKPTAPVYIRDLLSGLRDIENYDRQRLALSTAATLIRRKTNFGTEVSDHDEELAALLTGLNDKYDMENFQEMRLQAMIAILVAQPLKMGQWFSKTFFDGDYSMGQRASILSTLGIGARELAGYKSEDAALTGADPVPEFPSKMLPERLHAIYAAPVSPVDALSKRLETTMIAPMAAEVADKVSGPDVLKVRTFSSRMDVEKRRKKPITNQLAKVVADGFFFPLTGRWWVQLKTYGAKSVYFDPFLLTSYLKTLALILHASGPSTLSLPQMTSEFWDLLLSLRQQSDPAVLEALLFAMLTLLEINEDKRRLAEEHSKELLETQGWVNVVFEASGRGSGGSNSEGERVRVLAASLLMRIREVVEKYQGLLMGEMFDFD